MNLFRWNTKNFSFDFDLVVLLAQSADCFSWAKSSDRLKAPLDRMLASAAGLKKSASYIDYVNGCFNYYDNDGEYKRKPNPSNSEEPLEPSIDVISAVVQSNGSMIVKGRVNNAPSEFDYQTLRPDFLGDGALTGPSMVQAQGNGLFTMFVVATPTDAFGPKADAGKPVELRITTAGDFQTQANGPITSKNCIPRPMWPPPAGTDVAKDCHKFTLQDTFGRRVHQGVDAMKLIIAPQVYINRQKLFSNISKEESYLNGLNFYNKNLIYNPGFSVAFTKTDTSNGKITAGNSAFISFQQLAKSMMHEYVFRRLFMNGELFSTKFGLLEIGAYNATLNINSTDPNKSITFRTDGNPQPIRLGSTEANQDKKSKNNIQTLLNNCPTNNPKIKNDCNYVLQTAQKSPEYQFDRREYE